MKIIQKNKNNTTGFFQKDRTDFGVDEHGNLADGFQFHDALVWKNSPGTEFLNRDIKHMPLDEFLELWHNMFSRIAKYLVNTIQPKYVLDLGCGSGQLSNYIRKLDPNIVTVTVDANREVINSPYIDSNHFIARTDQSLDFTDSKGNKILFDLIISFEHFEHISDSTVDMLMQNIKDHSKIDTHLIFTACTTKYTADDHEHIHCNAQHAEYWINHIRTIGFEPYDGNFILDRAGHTSEIFTKRIN
jgi:2-polyprenyl-3-methyl-5-hydroxy-6-metoxy-1,4-benzoquinol methylase